MSPTEIAKGEMSFWAKYFYTKVCLEMGTCVYVGVQYTKLPELPELYAALKRLVDENPPLGLNIFAAGVEDMNCNIVQTPNGPVKPDPPQNLYAAQLKEVDFSTVVENLTNFEIHDFETVKYILQRKFEYGSFTKPLWKVTLLKDNWLIFSYDHAFIDGMSGANIQKKLVVILNDMNKNNGSYSGIDSTYKITSGSPDDNFGIINIYEKPENTWGFATRNLLDSKIYPGLKSSAKALVQKIGLNPTWLGRFNEFECNAKYVVQKNRFIDNFQNVSITAKDVEKLIGIGKKHGNVGFNSLMGALLSVSAKNTFVLEEQSVPFMFLVSERLKRKLDPESIGILIKAEEETTPILSNALFDSVGLNHTEFWKFASQVHADMTKAIDTGNGLEHFNMVGLQDLVTKVKAQEGSSPHFLFCFSNLSLQFKEKRFKEGNGMKYAIKDAVFNQSQVYADYFTVSSIATPKGGFNMYMVYQDEVKKETELLLANFEKLYKELINSV